jgi:hypothetical protein
MESLIGKRLLPFGSEFPQYDIISKTFVEASCEGDVSMDVGKI